MAKKRSRVHTVNILKMCVIFCKTEAQGRSIESRWNFLNDKSWHESRAKQFVLLMISQSLKAYVAEEVKSSELGLYMAAPDSYLLWNSIGKQRISLAMKIGVHGSCT